MFGDTKTIKDELKSIGGKFNPRLNYNGGKRAGWIFPKSKLGELDKFIHDTGTNDTITALENDNKTIIEQPNDKEERTPMNPADFMAFASYVQNIAINEGYIHARNHVKEKLKRYSTIKIHYFLAFRIQGTKRARYNNRGSLISFYSN